MGDQKSCVHCGRQIDAVARSCPFCNGDQLAAPRPRPSAAAAAASRRPPASRWRGKILGGAAFLALLIASFAIGSLIHGYDVPLKNDKTAAAKPAPTGAATVAANPAASDITLVPVTDTTSTLEASITSAPVPNPNQSTPGEYQRSDATALPSDEYARAAQKVKAERQQSATVDPRTIAASPQGVTPPARSNAAGTRNAATGDIPERMPVADSRPSDLQSQDSVPPQAAPATRRTQPEPVSQPLPRIDVDQPSRATLNLTIGPDGRVREVEVVQSIAGATDKLIGAVQTWRFKPATENGVPTTGTFQVNISLNPSHR
jgi:TonB family protein